MSVSQDFQCKRSKKISVKNVDIVILLYQVNVYNSEDNKANLIKEIFSHILSVHKMTDSY